MNKTNAQINLNNKISEVDLWKIRLKYLLEAKKMKRSEFCRKHGIYESMFCRILKLQSIPTWKTISNINAAFEAEGIK